MIESFDNPSDVDSALERARSQLSAFESGVDRQRLLERLQTASPAHPVLLARAAFLVFTVSLLLLALVAIVAPLALGMFADADQVWAMDLGRQFSNLDKTVPVPGNMPGIPTVFLVVSLCMFVGWVTTTFAALAIGRETSMVPWEGRAHQKLVNEITRLTTQKAVLARISQTSPHAGGRSTMATPVPMSLRDRGKVPKAASFGGGLDSARPSPMPAMAGGGFRPDKGSSGGVFRPGEAGGSSGSPSTPHSGALGTRSTGHLPPTTTPSTVPEANPRLALGVAFGKQEASDGPPVRPRPLGSMPPMLPSSTPAGLPARTGLGSPALSGVARTPYGAPPRGGTPLGQRPRRGKALGARASDTPLSQAGAPSLSVRTERVAPPQVQPPSPRSGGALLTSAEGRNSLRVSTTAQRVPTVTTAAEVPDIVEGSPYIVGIEEIHSGARKSTTRFPRWGRIDEPWLEAAIQKAEKLAHVLPVQAHLEFSQEDHLPFSLVMARATPAMAVRCMVSYVEFLSGIPTPPLARIEFSNVGQIDGNFHRNIKAALEPYFHDGVEVEPEPGRVDIMFLRPDPGWQSFPRLPTK